MNIAINIVDNTAIIRVGDTKPDIFRVDLNADNVDEKWICVYNLLKEWRHTTIGVNITEIVVMMGIMGLDTWQGELASSVEGI